MGKTLKHIKSFSPLLYLGISLLAFYPCLFQGKAYFDNDLLAQFGPWRAFLKDQLAQGHFPLWNPYNLGGQPFFADPQNMMLYPFNWLTLPFSLTMGLSLFFTLHLFWAAWGMDLWLGALGLSTLSRRVGALIFSLSGFFWLEIIHPPVLAAFSWLPWLFFSLERLTHDPKGVRGFWIGLVFANLFLCGSPQVTLGAFYAGVGFLVWRWVKNQLNRQDAKAAKKIFLSKTILSIFLVLWGALPLLAQFIPTQEFISLSDRGVPGLTYEQANSRLPLNPKSLYQLLLPRIGLPQDQTMAEAIQFGNSTDDNKMAANLGFLGVWVPFLAFWAFRSKDRSTVIGLGLWAGLGLLLSLGRYTPLHRIFCAILPGLSYVHVPYRFIFLFVLPMAALAAFGFEKAFEADGKGARFFKTLLYSTLVYGLVLYVIGLWRPALDWRELLALGLVQLGLLLAASKLDKGFEWGKGLAVVGLVLPLLLSGWDDFKPDAASNFDFEGNSKGIVEAAKELGPQRSIFYNTQMGYPIIVGGRKYILNYPQNCACVLKIKNWGGYNPLFLKAKKDVGTFPLKAQLQFGAIGGVFTQGRLAPIPEFTEETHGPYYFYRHTEPFPYAYAPNKAITEPDQEKCLNLLGAPNFDASKTVVLSDPGPAQNYPSDPGFRCDVTQDEADTMEFSLSKKGLGPVVFCEVMYPGWKAYVDGKETPIFTADHFLRGLMVPDGTHKVEMRLEPTWWPLVKWGLSIWAFFTLSGFVLVFGNKKKH